MRCPVCGYENREGVVFCERCLASMDIFSQELPSFEEGVFCPFGHWNPPGAKFCSICGAPLEETIEQIPSKYKLFHKGSNKTIPLPDKEEDILRFVIGRKSANSNPDIDLTDFPNSHTVSRLHAALVINKITGEITLEDLESTNGTYVNGERLQPHKPKALKNGDKVSFSRKLEFIFLIEDHGENS
ncbi:MAG: hypothetical protein DRQ03_01270 [Candidatus Hydrothermota bacterium]|nr:MAG: hypothetical protein DRQ03_01270 [Candidatus Hydrothermae bacterium]